MNAALALVNSLHWYGRGPDAWEDQLERGEWLETFLRDFGLTPGRAPSRRERTRLAELRDLLRRLVTAIAREGAPPPSALEELDAYLARSTYVRRVRVEHGEVHVELAPTRRDWDWVLAEIAGAFADLLAEGEPERIKLCDNDECGWSFYDLSKNRRRRWCGASMCGNVDKVRRFRERQRAARAATG